MVVEEIYILQINKVFLKIRHFFLFGKRKKRLAKKEKLWTAKTAILAVSRGGGHP